MAIYSEFSHKKMVIFHSYVSLPEGIDIDGSCFVILSHAEEFFCENWCSDLILKAVFEKGLTMFSYASSFV